MALTRLCPFCLEPQRECVCPDEETSTPDDEPVRFGLVIEWPAPQVNGRAFINPRLVSVFEITPEGERQVLPVSMSLHLSPDELVAADIELLAGEDGEPIGVKQLPAVRDGETVTTVRRYEVAEMRVRRPVA